MPLQVSKDSCLYAETYISRLVASDNSNAAKVAQIDTGLYYYAGKTSLTPDQAFSQIFGVNLDALTNFSSDGQVSGWGCHCLAEAACSCCLQLRATAAMLCGSWGPCRSLFLAAWHSTQATSLHDWSDT